MSQHEEMLTLSSEDDGEETTLRATCQELLTKSQFVDVTLSCLDGQLQAHRLVLCSVSGYLYELFTANPTMNPCTHPMVILRDCKVAEVQLALQYVYAGRALVPRSKLEAVLNAAKELGCESLERSVNRILQSPSPSPPEQMPQLLSPSTTPGVGGVRSLLSQITKAISVKTERETESLKDRTRKRSRSPSPSSNKDGIPQMPKLFRMASAGSKRSKGRGGSSNAVHPSEPLSPPILRKMTQTSQSTSPVAENDRQVLLQHDKAESFVYTNENLDMIFGGENADDDEDPNESEEDEMEMVGQEGALRIKTERFEEGVVDEKPSTCPWCNQLFTSVGLLQRHIKTHVGSGSSTKPYTCPYCTHEFARSAHLKRHVRTHTGEKPYKCTYCDKEFSRQDKMKTHISRHLQGNLPTTSGNNTNNDSLVRTCYPPVAMSQNTGGQVPIKILIPTNQGTMVSTSRAINSGSSSDPALSPSSFFNDRHAPSITINAAPPDKTTPTPTRQPRRLKTQLKSFA